MELGAGDATKSRYLLQGLLQAGVDFSYLPIDISANVIRQLEDTLPQALPGLRAAMYPEWGGGAFGEVLDGGRVAVGDPVTWEE